MIITIEGITEDLLEEIIEEIGSLSIRKCEPYVQNDCVMFDISITGDVTIFTKDNTVTIIKDDRKKSIDRFRFCRMVIA